MKNKVTIYCDGACLGNPGPGGYAALLMYNRETLVEKVIYGSEALTTNNQMELKAAIEGLKALRRQCVVELHTDSQYVIKGMTEWLHNWRKNDFRNAQKKEVKNRELWEELSHIAEKHEVSWHWVKGHSGHVYNDRVDEMAREQALLAQHQTFQAKI